MDVLEAIKNRRSIRKYSSRPVEDEKLQIILEAARWAPSAGNKQPWHFIIVKDPEVREFFGKIHPYGEWMKESPVVIVAVGDPKKHPKYYLCDAHQAVQNLMLAAYSLDLGTCWMGVRGRPEEEEFKKRLDVPDHMRVICAISVGYPDHRRRSTRFPLKQIISWEQFGKK